MTVEFLVLGIKIMLEGVLGSRCQNYVGENFLILGVIATSVEFLVLEVKTMRWSLGSRYQNHVSWKVLGS